MSGVLSSSLLKNFHRKGLSQCSCRTFSLSAALEGKNFKRFSLGNKRGTRQFKKERHEGKHADLMPFSPVRPIGYAYGRNFVPIPEMIPQLVVPNLEGCKLKPYVSYRTPLITEDPFTAQDLFNVAYKPKIISDFKNGKITETGESTDPSLAEQLSPEEAYLTARKTGSDIQNEREKKYWEFLDIKLG